MSKWGLKYKATEPLRPSDWNRLVDALDELNTRTPAKMACGLATFSGDGETLEFNIEHELGESPTCVVCGKGGPDLPDIDYWVADDNYITVIFKEAPPENTENVKIWYFAIIKT